MLQRPELRAIDGGKASLKVGQKIPYVSGSLNSAVATPGSIPYATTQFQQVDVGTLLDLQPHVNGDQDVSMHVKVEISNVPNYVLIAGIQEPVIGQQVDEADIRMRDGEVSILGGLSDKETSVTYGGLPGFTNIPLLNYVFGSKAKTVSDQEILIVLTPHIVRAPDLSNIAEQGVYAGTERVVKVERKPDSTGRVNGRSTNSGAAPSPAGTPQQAVPPVVRPQPLPPNPRAPGRPPVPPASTNPSSGQPAQPPAAPPSN